MATIVVLGAGMSGLIAAKQLQAQGQKVIVVDKGYGIGGRLASRSLKQGQKSLGHFDYGMQYFMAQDSQFQDWVEAMVSQQVVMPWMQKFHQVNGDSIQYADRVYRGKESNRAIAQHLAQGLNIVNQTRIERLTWQGKSWQLTSTHAEHFEADGVILTAPVPQSLEILATSKLELETSVRSRLESVRYAPCLALMAVLEKPLNLPSPGAMRFQNAPLGWIACNHQKGISPEGYAVTFLASEEYSENHWEEESEAIIAELLQAAKPWSEDGVKAIATRLHRWKYSHPTQVLGQRALWIEQPGPLVLAGDAFCDRPCPDIALTLEQAFLSGHRAAQLISEAVQGHDR